MLDKYVRSGGGTWTGSLSLLLVAAVPSARVLSDMRPEFSAALGDEGMAAS
jgi:hypothetical protein